MVISVKELNLSPLYSAVDHSHGNDNAAFGGDESVVRQFCPYPLPLFYRLSSVLHQASRQIVRGVRKGGTGVLAPNGCMIVQKLTAL